MTEVRTEGCVEDRQGMWVTGLTSIVRGKNQPVKPEGHWMGSPARKAIKGSTVEWSLFLARSSQYEIFLCSNFVLSPIIAVPTFPSEHRHLYFEINFHSQFLSWTMCLVCGSCLSWIFPSYGVGLQISQRMGILTSGIIPKWDYCHDKIWISETEIGFVNLLKWESKLEYTESMAKPF